MPKKKIGLTADDFMGEAARKTLNFYFNEMRYHEPGVRKGTDIEELHDMRVATRRMRAAIRVFQDYLDPAEIKPIFKGLRRTGRALGPVRDLDVFKEKVQEYSDSLPDKKKHELEPLQNVLDKEYAEAREKMLEYLDSKKYMKFKKNFTELLNNLEVGHAHGPGLTKKGEPIPLHVRHIVPVFIYHRFAEVRAYDRWVAGPHVPAERLHTLRISIKKLRYTIEFFREVLGLEASHLIKECKVMQDHLGNLQDAVVASDLLRDFLVHGIWGTDISKKKRKKGKGPVDAPGIEKYLEIVQKVMKHLLDTFPKAWAKFRSPEFSKRLAAAIGVL